MDQPLGGSRWYGAPVGIAVLLVASACSFGGASLTGDNVYAKLAEGGIYCANERVEQPVSYVERPDGTTESASPLAWTYADCETDSYSFTVRMYGSSTALSEAIANCALGDRQGFVSRGQDWLAYWGGLEPLDRREADEVSTALGGESVSIPDLCDASTDSAPSPSSLPIDTSALVDELMAEIGDEGMPEGATDCIRQGLSGYSTEELTALRDGETDADVPVELQEKVIAMMTSCVTE